MNAVERLADALKVGGKERGFKRPVYRPDGSLDHYARQNIALEAGDVLEVCKLASDQKDATVLSQTKGCGGLAPETVVVLQADCAFRLVELATAAPAPPPAPVVPESTPAVSPEPVPAHPTS